MKASLGRSGGSPKRANHNSATLELACRYSPVPATCKSQPSISLVPLISHDLPTSGSCLVSYSPNPRLCTRRRLECCVLKVLRKFALTSRQIDGTCFPNALTRQAEPITNEHSGFASTLRLSPACSGTYVLLDA